MSTNLVIVLDRSGSMNQCRDDHVGGLRSFIRDQKKALDTTLLTLIQFDDYDPCEVIINNKNVNDVDEDSIDLVPRGGTPLLDAIGKSIALTESNSGDDVIMMIITDGEENMSREWTKENLKKSIESKQKDGWKFLFLGANIDSFKEGSQFGVNHGSCADFKQHKNSVNNMYKNVSGKMLRRSSMKYGGASCQACNESLDFSDEDRKTIGGEE